MKVADIAIPVISPRAENADVRNNVETWIEGKPGLAVVEFTMVAVMNPEMMKKTWMRKPM